ncbi:hypothetical protein HPO_18400 [Hyphomonas polymorpha PS728]|uniref:Uncharacterized protein n=1 Tax=Hyphomonas polymorpha PS728 TaxID=1280954 RepID=A0A062V4H3_9PROT|nr:hypothetical protein [Hyphomonas polymorpha]KCZ96777.1 hypothetical protein HPO_18400 [Hyphomonas polymorpha PS728]
MPKPLFTSGEIARAIGDGRKELKRFYEGRVRTLIENGLLVPEDKTDGGHLRFTSDQVALAAIYSAMLDLGLTHGSPGKSFGCDASPFMAAQFALIVHQNGKRSNIDFSKAGPEEVLAYAAANPNALGRAIRGVTQGEWWALRIDLSRDDQTGEKRFLAVAYNMDDPPKDYLIPTRPSEMPAGSILLTLNPILLPLVADRSGAN